MDEFNKVFGEMIERWRSENIREKLAIKIGYEVLDLIERVADYLKEGGWG